MDKQDVISLIEKMFDEDSQDTIETTIIQKNEAQRKFWAIVLEPNSTVADDGVGDAHGHVMSEEEVEKAAHYYMENSQQIYKDHRGEVSATVIESFIAPADYTFGGESIKKGSWVMGVKVYDEELWEGIEKGEYAFFSPGGVGYLTNLQ